MGKGLDKVVATPDEAVADIASGAISPSEDSDSVAFLAC